MLELTDYTQRIGMLKQQVSKAFLDAGKEFDLSSDRSDTIRLVFAGQYSAGKSSILKMLTGREDIEIGEGITTQQANTYTWNGIEVIDTPGIHTELRPDHDVISYEAIASADMLVFVITNELFDTFIADHFRKLAIDKDKAGEMILVVNKMERAADGNSQAQQTIIRDDLCKVLKPYTPEQLHLSFLDAESYLDSVVERDTDAELADELVDRSGYDDFISTLNQFVKSKNITSKLTTELYIIDEQLDKAIKELQPRSVDPDIDGLEETFMQQRHALTEARGRMQQEIKNVYASAASKIRDLGLDSANLIVEGCKQESVEEELGQTISKANDIIENCQSEAAEIVDSCFNEMGKKLEDIENSEFSKMLKSSLVGKFESLPEGIKRILNNAGSGFQKAGQVVLNNAYKAGVQGGLKLTNFSGSNLHQMVLKVGQSLGYKFKPWQAIKITKGIAIGGEVLSVLGVGLNVFMQIKADHDEEKTREVLRLNRQNIRSQFNAAANELEDFSRQYIEDSINRPLEKSIADIDENIQEIRDSRENRDQQCRTFEALQKECRLLIQDIHSADKV